MTEVNFSGAWLSDKFIELTEGNMYFLTSKGPSFVRKILSYTQEELKKIGLRYSVGNPRVDVGPPGIVYPPTNTVLFFGGLEGVFNFLSDFARIKRPIILDILIPSSEERDLAELRFCINDNKKLLKKAGITFNITKQTGVPDF